MKILCKIFGHKLTAIDTKRRFARCARCDKGLKISYDMLYGETYVVGDYGYQTSFCWCECGQELLGDEETKVYEGGTFTNLICSNCGIQSKWNLDAPAPIFISSLSAK